MDNIKYDLLDSFNTYRIVSTPMYDQYTTYYCGDKLYIGKSENGGGGLILVKKSGLFVGYVKDVSCGRMRLYLDNRLDVANGSSLNWFLLMSIYRNMPI